MLGIPFLSIAKTPAYMIVLVDKQKPVRADDLRASGPGRELTRAQYSARQRRQSAQRCPRALQLRFEVAVFSAMYFLAYQSSADAP